MDRRTFDDVTVGETLDCGTNSVTREDVLAFGEAFDPLGMHTDADAAAESPFGGLIASGIHTLALTQPPVVERFYADSDLVASRGFESVRLPAPVRPGDTLHVFSTSSTNTSPIPAEASSRPAVAQPSTTNASSR